MEIYSGIYSIKSKNIIKRNIVINYIYIVTREGDNFDKMKRR